MIFAFYLRDNPDSTELRRRLRPEHREYVGRVADRIAFAGGLLAEDGETRVGSLLVMDFPDKAAAEAWLQDEPFTKNGLYASVEIQRFKNLWPQRTGFPEAP